MTPERWQQIEEIFNEAVELGEAERLKFLSTRTDGDTELRAEVEKLLTHFDQASDFIEQPLYDSARSGMLLGLFDDLDDDPMVGKVLGNYRIEREIGRGGMGAVYEAVRADGEFRLRVALKVVKRGVDTDFVLRRFRNERQILAALDHPYITRLIDGGTTDDGRPYFVMEFIDGLPLYRYCDRNRLSVKERLSLFTRVCEAVEYAHQKQVIHRDLKPSNIFITKDGTPRLLDFGIAKLLDPELAVDTLRPTATALRMMTVDYASPEQIRGEPVTYATDVYSLGVVLFELLTGFRPYSLPSRSPHDVARAICDDEPQLPSEAVGGSGLQPVPVSANATTLIDIADLRRESPSDLRSQLKGDLDSIICTAIQKSPSDRYASVELLRTDIQRHLDGEDISVHRTYTPPLKAAHSGAANEAKLVAVLPLSLMAPSNASNTDEAYLTVGLADAIITRLASVRKLTVRPTSSIIRYNQHQINPFRAGKELGVDFVLDGRIRRFGDHLRISLQLLDVNNGSAIWAGQFDEHLTDVLQLEDAISEQVANALIPQLTGQEKEKLAKRGTNDPRAYEAYLRGRFYWNQFTAQSFPKALEAFTKAIEIDPEYALAHVGVADFYVWANIYGLLPVAEAYEKAEAAARRALALDPELGEAYASMGLITHNKFEYGRSERLLRRAIDLIPHYSLAHEWCSAVLIGTGRFEEGLAEIRLAEELDPLSLRTKILVVWSYYQAGEIATALSKVDEVLDLDENYPQGHLQRGYILSELDRGEEAVAELELGNRLMPGSALAQYYLCFGYAAAGRQADAEELAVAMEERSRSEYVKPMFLGLAHVAVGRIDKAFGYLEKAVEERDPWLIWLGTEQKLRVLHGDPRYTDLLHKTNKTFAGGKLQTLSSDRDVHTSLFDPDPDTSPETGPDASAVVYRPNFFQRNVKKFGIAAAILVLLGIGVWSGFLGIEFRGLRYRNGEAAKVPSSSLAVLPFENATGDPANDYISDGMSESLISRISSSTNIRTVPRSATFGYRNKVLDPKLVGRELGVDSILTGTLERQGDDYVLKLEMTGVADGRSQLSVSIVEKPDRIFALQDALYARVTTALDLQPGTVRAAPKSYTENNEAFQLYLKGEYSRQKGTPEGTAESLDFYKQAIELDPTYALAYQGLALGYRSSPAYGSMSPQEAFPLAKEAAQKALSLDPSLSTAYASLASIKATYDWDFPGAEQEYKRAIQLSPNNAEIHYSYGNFLVAMGRADEALVELRNAFQIDPSSLNIQTNVGWALYIAGRTDEAAAQVKQVIERDPTFARAHLSMGEIFEEQGKYDDAIASIQKARTLSKDPLADMALGHTLARAGRRAEALKVAADLEEKVRQKKVSPFLPAVVYAGLKDNDKAFYWLERAYQERSNWLALIKVGRRLKSLNGDPRFDDLLKRIGFS